jgi:hypothetical protein
MLIIKVWITQRHPQFSWIVDVGYAYTIRFVSFEYSIPVTNTQ